MQNKGYKMRLGKYVRSDTDRERKDDKSRDVRDVRVVDKRRAKMIRQRCEEMLGIDTNREAGKLGRDARCARVIHRKEMKTECR
jgi:hypothetical protein